MEKRDPLLEFDLDCESDDVIEFSGTVSEEARLDRANRINKIIIIPLIILEIIYIALIVWLSLQKFYEYLAIFIPLAVIGVIVIVMMYLPIVNTKLWYAEYLTSPITITINNGKIINSYFVKSRLVSGTKSLSRVKKVIDAGEWYYIIFKFGDIGNSWICQKNLLTQGTIEDFEKLFETKIVRK